MATTSIPARDREDRTIIKALRIIDARARAPGYLVEDRDAAIRLFRLSLSGELREHFEVAFLDSRHCLLSHERLFSGSIADAAVRPRIVVQRALMLNAAAVICAHNHPSGNPSPSDSDREMTDDLGRTLAMVDVCLLDHLVIGARGAVSVFSKMPRRRPAAAPRVIASQVSSHGDGVRL